MTSYHSQLVDDEGDDDHANFPEHQNVTSRRVFTRPTRRQACFPMARSSTTAPADFAWADFLGAAAAPHEGCSGRYGGRDVML